MNPQLPPSAAAQGQPQRVARRKAGDPPILIAFKSLVTCERLTLIQRRVGVALLDHYNRKTQRCDPSNETIGRILGVSTRSVVRATAALVGAGMFRKHVHGGLGHRNRYEPNWSEFERQELLWRRRRAGARRTSASWPALSSSHGQPCQAAADTAVQQTCPSNLSEQTLAAACTSASANSRPRRGLTSRPGKERQALQSSRPNEAGVLPGRNEAADQRAIARLDADLRRHFLPDRGAYGEALEAIDSALLDRATAQERMRPGGGLALLLHELQMRSLTAGDGLRDG